MSRELLIGFMVIGCVACGESGDSALAPSSSAAVAPPVSKLPPPPNPGAAQVAPTQGAPMTPTPSNRAPARVMSNPFVLTASDPFSTFAADVDTASYDIFRRAVLKNTVPPAESMRLEEFVNYFRYNYPKPALDAEVPFSISLAAGPHVSGGPTKLLRVGIQAATVTERRPANVVFLVDLSGSMSDPKKLPLVQRTLLEALDVLDPKDTVAIVTYSATTQVRLPSMPVSEREPIATSIKAMQASGSTNGGMGIQLAYEQAHAHFIEGGINHVVLCTDGDFNLGLTSDDELVQLIERERKTGVTLTALGVGDRSNDAMMERVSDAGNGTYSVLYNEDQAIAYAHQRLLSSMTHVAQDMKFQVEFNADQVYAYRLLGYEDRAVADTQFRNDRVDGGEVGSGFQVTALFELVLREGDLPANVHPSRGENTATRLEHSVAPEDLVRVSVRWKRPGAAATDSASESSTTLASSALVADDAALDDDAAWAMGVARLAEVAKGTAPRSELPRIRELLMPLAGDDAERNELLALLPKFEALGAR